MKYTKNAGQVRRSQGNRQPKATACGNGQRSYLEKFFDVKTRVLRTGDWLKELPLCQGLADADLLELAEACHRRISAEECDFDGLRVLAAGILGEQKAAPFVVAWRELLDATFAKGRRASARRRRPTEDVLRNRAIWVDGWLQGYLRENGFEATISREAPIRQTVPPPSESELKEWAYQHLAQHLHLYLNVRQDPYSMYERFMNPRYARLAAVTAASSVACHSMEAAEALVRAFELAIDEMATEPPAGGAAAQPTGAGFHSL